jgi:phage-related minor tail protein
MRGQIPDRLVALERRADGHDQVIKPMAEQVSEMYELLTKWRNINWFVVKAAAIAGGIIGFVAIVLTIIANGARLITGH